VLEFNASPNQYVHGQDSLTHSHERARNEAQLIFGAGCC